MSSLDFLKKINKKHIIGIGIIIIITIIITISIVYGRKQTKSSKSSEPTTTTISIATTKSKADTDKINTALASAGISRPGQENFEPNTIVFDTKEKVINNFDLFMNTYYPSLNIAEMNNMLKKYGVPKTIQELLIENINSSGTSRYISNLGELIEFYPNLFGIEFKTGGNLDDVICAGLGLLVLVKVFDENQKGNYFYLNDFKDTNEFYIYKTPKSYDISKVLSMKSEIEIKDYKDTKEYYKNENGKRIVIKPYKIGLFSMSINKIKQMIQYKKAEQYKKETGSDTVDITKVSVSEEEINLILQSLKDSRESYLKYIRILLIKDFIILYTKQYFTESSQIVKDYIELLKPENKHFNENLYQYQDIENSKDILWQFNSDKFMVMPTTSPQVFRVPDNSTLPATSSALVTDSVITSTTILKTF